MPTMATSFACARPVLSCTASAWYSASASSLGVRVVIEILLQNDRGGACIDHLAALGFQDSGRITFIHQRGGNPETPVQLIRETATAHGHLMLGAVRMQRQADDAAR